MFTFSGDSDAKHVLRAVRVRGTPQARMGGVYEYVVFSMILSENPPLRSTNVSLVPKGIVQRQLGRSRCARMHIE